MRIISIIAILNIVFVEASVCPDAQTAAGPCFEGECIDGYTCTNGGYCCPIVERVAAVLDSSSSSDDVIRLHTKTTTRKKFTLTLPVDCKDGAVNCGMFTGYCRPGTEYSSCMQTHCRKTCGYCVQG
ncbi:unnamed protein product [Bursaphelenchus xylophilus]|uniref:(pine wood nematode) hypothetical protein n=1 Tax=Bursaphelenchus xylophilus TaxID=6326 RepID=A0A1I7SG88_BURXY|nr:unnamed protein product [Bursaphelenchus xylophilus]CAG9118282.1 unnamed protein product [Bursaphelenchus xylophilus]